MTTRIQLAPDGNEHQLLKVGEKKAEMATQRRKVGLDTIGTCTAVPLIYSSALQRNDVAPEDTYSHTVQSSKVQASWDSGGLLYMLSRNFRGFNLFYSCMISCF
jgi:hypothetical protein